jgi:hypothetical protein
MHKRLQHNARVIFKSAESGAHADWVAATSFDELVTKIDKWRDVVFTWMDEMVSPHGCTNNICIDQGPGYT